MKRTKRIITILLTLSMLVICSVALSFATDEMPAEGGGTVKTSEINTWSDVQSWISAAEEGAVLQLPGDVTAVENDVALVVPADKSITIDLNGHRLSRGLIYDANENGAKDNGNAITVNGNLTIKDSSTGHDGQITGGANKGNGGGVVVNNGGVFTMESGSITGNVAAINGSIDCSGGGVYLNGGTFNMKGGSITGNVSRGVGGGVYINSGSFNIEGASVISDNLYRKSISDAGSQDNLPVNAGAINITGALDKDALIGVHPADSTDVNEQGKSFVLTSGLNGKGAVSNFESDDSNLRLSSNDSGELIMGHPYTVNYKPGDQGEGSMGSEEAINGEILTVMSNTFTPKGDYLFADWKLADGTVTVKPGDTVKVSRDICTKVDDTYEINFTAQWVDGHHTVTWKNQDGTDIDTSTVAHGGKPTRTSADPTKKADAQYSYTFAGWATEANQKTGKSITELPEVTEDTAYYAAYSETVNKYEVSFDVSGASGATTPDSMTLDYGSHITKPTDPTCTEGLTFGGWCKDENRTTLWDFENDTVKGTTTLYAKWVLVHDEITFQPWFSDNSLPAGSGNYYLVNDVAISETWEPKGGETTRLCLHGKTIRMTGNNKVIVVSRTSVYSQTGKTTLHIYDETGKGKITGGNGSIWGGGIYVQGAGDSYEGKKDAILYLHSGNITGNSSTGDGGGVFVAGQFYMYGGVISGNSAKSDQFSNGGGVYVGDGSNKAIFEMHGGTIEDNQATSGGGVSSNYEKIRIFGGSIINNKANTRGGGIETYGTTIIGGTSDDVSDYKSDVMSEINITGNTVSNKTNNLHIMNSASSSGLRLQVQSKLTEDSSIGLTSDTVPSAGKEKLLTDGLTGRGTADNFLSDKAYDKNSFPYNLVVNKDGEMALVNAYTISFDAGEGSGTADPEVVNDGEKCKLPDNPFTEPQFKSFSGWKVGTDEDIRQPGYEFAPTANTTVTAQWAYREWNVSFDANGGSGSMAPVTVSEKDEYELPDNTFTSPDNDHLFEKWEVRIGNNEPVYKSPGDKVRITADTVVKPVWSEYWTVSFDPNEKGTGEMAPIKVIKGYKLKLPENGFTSITHNFKDWKVDDNEYAAKTEVEISADTTVFAAWTAKKWKVFVSGVQADGDNCTDMLGDMDEGATVIYDPATKTLTLDNATIEADTVPGTTRYSEFGVRIGESGVNIAMNGKNRVKNDEVTALDLSQLNNHVYGAYITQDCTISGNGSLSIGMNADVDGFELYRGIEASADIVLDKAKIDIRMPGTVVTNGYRVMNGGSLTLQNAAQMHIDVDNTYAIDDNKQDNTDLIVKDGCVLEAACRGSAAFGNNIRVADETRALGALVGEEASADTARVWDGTSELSGTYKYVLMPYSVDDSAYKNLSEAISAAANAQSGVKISINGKELDPADRWVTDAEKRALDAAIAAAQAVLDDPGSSQARLEVAAADLNAAISTFRSSIKAGTMTEILDTTLPKVSIRKPAKAKKAVTVKWKKLSKKNRKKVQGIEIQYAGDKHFSDAKLVQTKKTKASKKIKKLSAKKTYWVRVRTYKYVGGIKRYSNWSKVRKCRTR